MLFGHPYLTPWHFILLFVVVLDILAGVLILLRGRKDLRTVFFAMLLLFAAFRDLIAREHEGVVMRKFRKVCARALLGLRHWTNEVVMVAFVRCDQRTPEQKMKLKQYLMFREPKWDEIASRIYTNKRAMEFVKYTSDV